MLLGGGEVHSQLSPTDSVVLPVCDALRIGVPSYVCRGYGKDLSKLEVSTEEKWAGCKDVFSPC